MFGRIEIRKVHQGFALRRRKGLKTEWWGEVEALNAEDTMLETWNELPIYRIVFPSKLEAVSAGKQIIREEKARNKASIERNRWFALAKDKGVFLGYVNGEREG